MSRKVNFLEFFGQSTTSVVKGSIGPKWTTINGIQFNNCMLWDALVEAFASIPNRTGEQGLLRRREEARGAIRARIEWLGNLHRGTEGHAPNRFEPGKGFYYDPELDLVKKKEKP